ncbi:prepilin-type N-terminal cleavage/methylation domain-containing protein [Desulfosalsimonas propionicica]|uniref:Prepilin-type N-terminal cleavage/methylation domain-containing protein n=1 Tax=Desulfosalsimonas propionicica TaxID=332175 RepID=A0A7W0C7S5_9BACT|nr:prepilin-type N-terminal cleavage/methylation domain-containing protein [Desulfosalsimonas propionicica]MBA2880692.1 prepilin-type N-terminal cleavage/methylation domain-containing protein [Desulfosalsimonas propionicica]
MNPSYRQNQPGMWKKSGFTLLEVLMAVVIFAVIATIVYSAMNAAISRIGAIKDGDRVFAMGAGCLHRISTDLRSAYADPYPLFTPQNAEENPDPYAFVGQTDFVGGDSFSGLQFAAFAHLPVSTGSADPQKSAAALAQLRYFVEKSPEPDRGYVLRRGDRPFVWNADADQWDEDSAPVLCTHITEFALTYFDHKKNDRKTWDSSDDATDYATPAAVEIFFRIETDQGNYPFLTRVVLPAGREPLERVKSQ